jgi:hypothetical protein
MWDEEDVTRCDHCQVPFEAEDGVNNEFVTLCYDCWYELYGDDEEVMDDEKGWL